MHIGQTLSGNCMWTRTPVLSALGATFTKRQTTVTTVIAIILFRAEITVRFAGAMNDAIGDGPGLRRIAVRSHAKRPAGKILAVEKLDVIRRRDGRLGILRDGRINGNQHEAKQNYLGGDFHCHQEWCFRCCKSSMTDCRSLCLAGVNFLSSEKPAGRAPLDGLARL